MRARTLITSALLGLLGGRAALAQEPPAEPPSGDASPSGLSPAQQAKQYFDDGQNLYIQGKFTEAAEKFLKAYEAKSYPAFLFNVAVCYEKNRDFAKALKYYEDFVKADPHSTDRKLVMARIQSIRQHLNPADPKSPPPPPTLPAIEPKGLVVIESNPEGAAIYLSDKKKGIFTRTPYTGSLPPGQHTIILELKEFQPVRKTFVARNDRMTYLFFSLTRQQNLGWIEIKANIPGADVFFDERRVGAVGRTPYSGYLRPGKRRLIVERPGYEPYEKDVEIVAGKTHLMTVALERVSYGWLKISGQTTRGATLKVDGKPLTCNDYPCQTKISQGTHKVELSRKGFKSYVTDVSVQNAEEVQLAVRLNPTPSRIKAYVSFGVAAALLAGGITAGVLSNKRASSLESDLTSGRIYDTGDPRFTEGKVTAIVADSLFVLSAVVAGLATYYLFRNEGADSYGETRTNKLAITPTLGPGVAGIGGQVRF